MGRGFGRADGARDGRRLGVGEREFDEARCGELAAGNEGTEGTLDETRWAELAAGKEGTGRENSGTGARGCEGVAFGVVCSPSSLVSVLGVWAIGGGGIAARSFAAFFVGAPSVPFSIIGGRITGGGGIAARSIAVLSSVRSIS